MADSHYYHEIFRVPHPGDWRLEGACRDVHTKLFFPSAEKDSGPAKAICADCTVVAACRAYALEHESILGIWGGATQQERDRMRRHHLVA